jgi:hypothetical protein
MEEGGDMADARTAPKRRQLLHAGPHQTIAETAEETMKKLRSENENLRAENEDLRAKNARLRGCIKDML